MCIYSITSAISTVTPSSVFHLSISSVCHLSISSVCYLSISSVCHLSISSVCHLSISSVFHLSISSVFHLSICDYIRFFGITGRLHILQLFLNDLGLRGPSHRLGKKRSPPVLNPKIWSTDNPPLYIYRVAKSGESIIEQKK